MFEGNRYERYYRLWMLKKLPDIVEEERSINLTNIDKYSITSLITSNKAFEDIDYTRKMLKLNVSTYFIYSFIFLYNK